MDHTSYIVMKFGGTSVAKHLPIIVDTIVPSVLSSSRKAIPVLVCSAQSYTIKAEGTTQRLLDAIDTALCKRRQREPEEVAAAKAGTIIEGVLEKHLQGARAIIRGQDPTVLKELESDLKIDCARVARTLGAVATLHEISPIIRDAIIAVGELMVCRTVVAVLKDRGIPACLVRLDDLPQSTMPSSSLSSRSSSVSFPDTGSRASSRPPLRSSVGRSPYGYPSPISDSASSSTSSLASTASTTSDTSSIFSHTGSDISSKSSVSSPIPFDQTKAPRTRSSTRESRTREASSRGSSFAAENVADRIGQRIDEVLEEYIADGGLDVPVLVATGFFGPLPPSRSSKSRSRSSRTPTPTSLLDQVGRGYTDVCASLIARATHAREVQIWKEVDGVFTADPRKMVDARLLGEISIEQAKTLTSYGSEVVHSLAIDQAQRMDIPMVVKNVANPLAKGTRITGPSLASSASASTDCLGAPPDLSPTKPSYAPVSCSPENTTNFASALSESLGMPLKTPTALSESMGMPLQTPTTPKCVFPYSPISSSTSNSRPPYITAPSSLSQNSTLPYTSTKKSIPHFSFALTALNDLSLIHVSFPEWALDPGKRAVVAVMEIIREYMDAQELSMDLMQSSQGDVCFVVKGDLTRGVEDRDYDDEDDETPLEKTLNALNAVADVVVTPNLTYLQLVFTPPTSAGHSMSPATVHPSPSMAAAIAGCAFSALAEAQVDIKMIAHGPVAHGLGCIIPAQDAVRAGEAIHKAVLSMLE
ncbi:hypothetical protein BDQ12DRAFT_728869 [Crucibulum laeve]|uniref:aspartate kinase n=1 Tax=Crucibulum laeve TaxID=68775 RepID=A0A5C3LHP9_9AGAR|nr:hypothetical protein BDQ12DRAFT_728869 [Crucibulum laeve]